MRETGPRTTTTTNGLASIGPGGDVLLIGRTQAARLCGISPASWDRLTAAGKTPASLRLGGRVLWRRSDLDAWIALGLPDRRAFETLTAK